MRVLLTADAVGGVWTFALELAHGLAARGDEVHLATMGPPPDAAQRAAAHAAGATALHVSRLRLEWMEGAEEDLPLAGEWLLDVAHRIAPDVVHLNGYAHAALRFPAPVVVGGHSCVGSWCEAVGRPPPEWFPAYRLRVRDGLAAADAVVCPTRAMLEALHRHYGPFPRGHVVPNGRRADLFPPGPKEEIVVSAGRIWDEAKNVAALAAAAPAIPWPVLVAGEEEHPDSGRSELPGVRRLGRLPPPELARLLGRAAIFALPARYEPFGLAALEAALAGCALVLGDIPSLREVWEDDALFVPPDRPGAIARAVAALCEDPAERERRAARARRRALALAPERTTDGHRRIYERLLPRAAVTRGGLR